MSWPLLRVDVTNTLLSSADWTLMSATCKTQQELIYTSLQSMVQSQRTCLSSYIAGVAAASRNLQTSQDLPAGHMTTAYCDIQAEAVVAKSSVHTDTVVNAT